MEQRPLLGSRFLISDNLMATIEQATKERCFLRDSCRDVETGTIWGNLSIAGALSWKGAAIQRGLDPGSRGIIIVRNCYQETISGDCNISLCSLVICKEWRSAMALKLSVFKTQNHGSINLFSCMR
jgi:hypothetical protein